MRAWVHHALIASVLPSPQPQASQLCLFHYSALRCMSIQATLDSALLGRAANGKGSNWRPADIKVCLHHSVSSGVCSCFCSVHLMVAFAICGMWPDKELP